MGFKCSECGGTVYVVELMSYPSKTRYTCSKCWIVKIEDHEVSDVVVNMGDAECV